MTTGVVAGRVTFTIEVAGQPLPQHISVYSIEVLREANRVPTACLSISDGNVASQEWVVSSDTFFVPGNEIKILAGYQSEEEPIFSGIVISHALRVRERRFELQVLCKDKTVALTTTRKSRHFADVTDSDAITEILGEYSIPASAIASTSASHTDLVQYDATDWDFIVMRAEANGLICVADEEGFHIAAPSIEGEPVATLEFGTNVIEFDADIDARRQYGSVTAQAWDPAAQEQATADGVDPSWTTSGNLAPASLATPAGGDTQVLRHGGSLGADELQSWSDAILLRSRMAFLRGRARIQGTAGIQSNTVVELAGFGDRVNGPAWVSAVRHEIGRGNWLTDVEFGMPEQWHAERCRTAALPAAGLLPAVAGLHTGVTTALEGDPAGEARIRVKIPSVDMEGDGIWARVSTLDAGSSRGAAFLPEIGDEVVVGFLNDDPRHPVVLGMMHSSNHAPPEEASDDNHFRGFHSRSGIRIRFDDENTILTIDTPKGQTMILDDKAGEIAFSDSHSNKITMSSSGITIESAGNLVLKASKDVNIEGKLNLNMKAGTQWKAEGSAGSELNSSGVTVVKGSLVQIN